MMKLSTKIIITVAVLMFSAVQSYASETCAADVNTCTPKQLCEASTSMMNNNKVWSIDPAYVEHVAMSKQLGINCGVVDVVAPTCETDAELCAVSALCEQATVASGSAKAWSEVAGKAGHVSLAKEYGLACDVLVAVERPKSCLAKSPAGCDDSTLCFRATNNSTWGGLLPYVDEAKKRGLTCGVGEGAKVSKTRDLPMCLSRKFFNNCFGTWTSDKGSKWIGSWKADQPTGVATYLSLGNNKWKGDVNIGMTKDGKIAGGQGLYIWHTGTALFEWVTSEKSSGNSTVNEVFPSLTRMFNNLPKHKRVAIQNSLAKKDLYTSTIDGAWGRNTLIGIGRFTAEHLNTINLKSSENVELVLDAIIEQGDLVRTKVAQPAVFDAVAKRDAGATKVASNSANFKDDYTSQSLLKRQQLQYALKKLGFYSSSIDGLWGSGTSSAIVEYAQANGVNSSNPSSVFSSILSKVDVPSSFEVAKPKVKVQESNAYGLVAIIPNPSVPASQAWAICDPQGDIAAGQAGAAYKAPSYGYSGSCNSYGSFANCNATPNSGGFAGGFAEGLARGITARKARKSALKSCLAQYGYRQ